MKSVLISNRPKWCGKICHEIGKDENGKPIYEKRIEVRKTAPKEVPFKAYIYCTQDRKNLLPIEHGKILQKVNFWENTDAYYGFGKVIGEFICDKVMFLTPLGLRGFETREEILKLICLTNDDLNSYGGLKTLYGWHISDLKIYDKPKELSEFIKPCPYGDSPCQVCEYYSDYSGECRNIITRPPQSWMYVEEVKQ